MRGFEQDPGRAAGTEVSDTVEPFPTARFVRVGAGNYAIPLSLAETTGAVLANELPSGRWRLIMARRGG